MNGNQWGSTKNHPFATLTYAINQTNMHTFPGNTINAPAGTKFSGSSVSVDRSGSVDAGWSGNYVTGTQRHIFRIDWNIADDSDLTQVDLKKYAYLDLPVNSVKGQKLPDMRLALSGTALITSHDRSTDV